MSQVKFSIPGEPCAKGRPRFIRATGQVMTPEKTANYEQLVKLSYLQQVERDKPLQGPLVAKVYANFAIPKSVSKKRFQRMISRQEYPQKRPDADNLAKIVLDALNGIAYSDDKEIVCLEVRKYWAEVARVDVVLREI